MSEGDSFWTTENEAKNPKKIQQKKLPELNSCHASGFEKGSQQTKPGEHSHSPTPEHNVMQAAAEEKSAC